MNLDNLENSTFHVWQPNSVSLIKSDGDDVKSWKIGGLASTDSIDRQGESVLQTGLDFSDFVHHGWFNDNHQQHTSAAVGVPEMAKFKKGHGWYVAGYLLKDIPRAKEIYQLAKSLSPTERRLGFSIEGKILERIGNKIAKALIRNVAITNSPVNTDCSWGLLAKSWATDLEVKALSAGHVKGAGGNVLVPEDLERDELKYIYRCPECRKSFHSPSGLERHASSSHSKKSISYNSSDIIQRPARELSREGAIEYLRRVKPEYSESLRTKLVDYVLRNE